MSPPHCAFAKTEPRQLHFVNLALPSSPLCAAQTRSSSASNLHYHHLAPTTPPPHFIAPHSRLQRRTHNRAQVLGLGSLAQTPLALHHLTECTTCHYHHVPTTPPPHHLIPSAPTAVCKGAFQQYARNRARAARFRIFGSKPPQ
jgi:hypothetical protein